MHHGMAFWLFSSLNLTQSPCSLAAFLTSLNRCGTLDGTHRLWDFKVNFVEVTWWINSLKPSLKLRPRHRLLFCVSKMPYSTNSSTHKPNLISNTSSSSFLSTNLHNRFNLHLFHPLHNRTKTGDYSSHTAGPSPSLSAEEMLQQMKHTAESSLQAMVDKTQERQATQPLRSHPPAPMLPHTVSQQPPLVEHPPPRQHSSRRSRSYRHHSSSRRHDKRPVSIPRSPRRRRSPKRSRRSSRPRSSSRDLPIQRQDSRHPDWEQSITLRSASP